ncbi:hypothetical protein CIY_26800 [Butyrivibrio fibrisolvens 16/4]|nr:hypothetical protein CIY_26800 [Butyrivibrio fibrisolvens 16/4]
MIKYASLIIDIEKSRKYGVIDRTSIQKILMDYVEILNGMFCESQEFKVTFSAGDSLQGLFVDVASAYMYYRLLEILIYPVKLRAGIGVGEWTIKIENGLSTQQDGPAYHNARQAIEGVYNSQLSNINIYSGEDDFLANHLINASLQLKRQQMPMQNYVQLLNELIFPFTMYDRVSSDFISGVDDLITIKAEALKSRQNTSTADVRTVKSKFEIGSLELDMTKYIKPIFVGYDMMESEYIISKNTQSTIIAEILQSSRQNAAVVMKRGNVLKIRELDYVAINYIRERYI